MTRFSISTGFFSGLLLIAASCSNQRYVSGETDDIYYSSSDRYSENHNEFSEVNETSGEQYRSNESAPSDEYFSVGKEQRGDVANPNAASAYSSANQNQFDTNYTSNGSGSGTVNNFYGSTNYYEGDYYDDSYSSQFRRFNSVNLGLSYAYYDPYFVSPYWNYGWSYWDYPYSGWNVGWNSWSGWNIGYSWGWGYPSYWNRPYYGYGYGGFCSSWRYGYGWGYPGYGCGYGYGYGYGYNNYWNGYWNGYYDGVWSDYYRDGGGRGRSVYNGRRNLAANQGFSNNIRPVDNPNAGGTINNRNTVKPTNNGGTQHTPGGRVSVVDNDVTKHTASQNSGHTRDGVKNSAEKFTSSSGLYQANTKGNVRNDDVNPRSQTSSSKYTASNQAGGRTNAAEKYNLGSLSRTDQVKNQYPAARPNTVTPNTNTRGTSVQPGTSVNAQPGTRNYSNQPPGTTRPVYNSGNSGRVETQTPRPQGSAYVRDYSHERAPSQGTRNYSTPRDNSNTTTRPYQQPSQSGTPGRGSSNVRPNNNDHSSGGRTYTSPQPSRQPSNVSRPSSSPSRNVSPGQGSGGSSVRGNMPSRGSSSPSMSAPSRPSSAPSGGGSSMSRGGGGSMNSGGFSAPGGGGSRSGGGHSGGTSHGRR